MPDEAHVMYDGTSQSAPVVAGAIALYLQEHPQATIAQIREALAQAARHDEYTSSHGPLPNNHWGYGKLDILRALTGVATAVALESQTDVVPVTSALHQNYPNPFNPSTQIRFDLAADQTVSVHVLNAVGQVVSTLVDERQLPAGRHSVRFDATGLSSGLYFTRLTYADQRAVRSMVLLK